MPKSSKPKSTQPKMIELAPGVSVGLAPLDSFTPDPRNMNEHTPRGRGLEEREMGEVGFGRPMLAADDGTMLAGNQSIEIAQQLFGDHPAIVIRTDGRTPIIHQRTDIEDAQGEVGRRAALGDNRIAQLSIHLQPAAIAALNPELRDKFYFAHELGDLVALEQQAADYAAAWQGMPEFLHTDQDPVHDLLIHFATTEDVKRFAALIDQTITDQTKSLWYPAKAPDAEVFAQVIDDQS